MNLLDILTLVVTQPKAIAKEYKMMMCATVTLSVNYTMIAVLTSTSPAGMSPMIIPAPI